MPHIIEQEDCKKHTEVEKYSEKLAHHLSVISHNSSNKPINTHQNPDL